MTELVSGIVKDAQELFRQEGKLLRREIQEDVQKTKEAAVPLGIGLWLILLGSILLSTTLALLLVAAGLPQWASFAVVGAALFLIGGGVFYVGKKKFDSLHAPLEQSAEALKENLEWLAKPK
jgi:high-affinity Fe2+/Pb2+ permease